MKRKNSFPPVFIIAIILLCTTCGSVFAFMRTKTPVIDNTIMPAVVSCHISEKFDGVNKTEIKVVNDSNVDVYLRVCFVTYWVNGENKVVAKPSETLEITDELYDEDKWIPGSNNIFYYKTSVPPDDSNIETNHHIVDFLETGKSLVLKKVTEDGVDYYQVIEIFAEAIQAETADAVTNSWQVTLTGNEITSAT